MSTINLNNPRLRKYIREVLEINRYTEPFATLIEEVFVREQYVLEFKILNLKDVHQNMQGSLVRVKEKLC